MQYAGSTYLTMILCDSKFIIITIFCKLVNLLFARRILLLMIKFSVPCFEEGTVLRVMRMHPDSIYLSLVCRARVSACEYVLLTLDSMPKPKKHLTVPHSPQRYRTIHTHTHCML